jgi:ABC-type amino acid transport substrate-binding protein
MRYLALALLALFFLVSPAQADTAFDRVMSKRELRCAYTIYPPFFSKDPNTGAFLGIFHDFLEQMGKELNIKIVWAEEVGTDNIFQGLTTDRYDAVCAGYFSIPSRANGGIFTKPLIYSPSYIYVRSDESRFKKPEDLNKAEITFATQDGEASQLYRNEYLPLSKEFAMAGITQGADRFEALAGGKADATVAEASVGNEYMANNPGKVKPLGDPALIYSSVVILSHESQILQDYLNAAIDSMHNSGAAERIVKKYNGGGAFLLPARAYELPKK